jgi:hypothetical protein
MRNKALLNENKLFISDFWYQRNIKNLYAGQGMSFSILFCDF